MKTTLFSSLHSPVSIKSDNLLKSGKPVMARDLGNIKEKAKSLVHLINERGGRGQGTEH